MRDFRVIYRVLKAYKGMLHDGGSPFDKVTPDSIGTTRLHLANITDLLKEAKLISGASPSNTSITLAGLEYLVSNEQMRIVANEEN